MKVVICGAGSIGSSVVQFLSFHYDIVVIDQDARALDRIAARYDVQTICGSAADPEILEKIGGDRSTHIIAVTSSDEVNLVACHLAHIFGSAVNAVARLERPSLLRGELHEKVWQKFGLNGVFSAHSCTSRAVVMGLAHAYSFDAVDIGDGSLILLGLYLKKDHPWVGKTLKEIQESGEIPFSVARIMRNHLAWIPNENDHLLPRDALYVLIEMHHKDYFKDLWGWKNTAASSVVFLGSSPVLFASLPAVLSMGLPTRLVSDQEEDLLRVSQSFPSVKLYQGAPMDPEVVRLAMENGGVAVAVGACDAENMMVAGMAYRCGGQKSIVSIQDGQYMSPLWLGGMGQMVHAAPRALMTILHKINPKGPNIYPLQGLASGTVIHAIVPPGCAMDGQSCQDGQEEKWRVLAVHRKGSWIWIPQNVQALDRVVLTALPEGYAHIQDALSVSASG